MRQTKERDRELGSHRRMRGWGRARDNSTIVQGGVGGQTPRGRKLALFPCTGAGPWLAGRAGSVLEETGAELIAGAQVTLSPNTTFQAGTPSQPLLGNPAVPFPSKSLP